MLNRVSRLFFVRIRFQYRGETWPHRTLSIREADRGDVFRRTLFPYLRRRFEQGLPDCCHVASYDYMRVVILSTPSNLMMLPYCIILPFVHWEREKRKP